MAERKQLTNAEMVDIVKLRKTVRRQQKKIDDMSGTLNRARREFELIIGRYPEAQCAWIIDEIKKVKESLG